MPAEKGKVTSIEEIRRQVEERRAEEQEQRQGGGGGSGDGVERQFVQDCLTANELGDGTLFAHLHRGRYVYNYSTDEWLEWGGHSWRRIVPDRVKFGVEAVVQEYLAEKERLEAERREAIAVEDGSLASRLEERIKATIKRMNRLRSSAGRRNCLEFSHSCEEPIGIEEHRIDMHSHLLAVANGVVDLRTGELRDGRPEDWLLRSSPVEYDQDADMALWEKTLWEIYENEEKIAFLKRLVGMSLFGHSGEHIMAVFFGKGRNGKDTIWEMIQYVLGDLAGTIQPEMLMDQGKTPRSAASPSPEIMSLKGLRIAVGSETEQGARLALGRTKWLTGGGTLTGRYPHDKRNTSFEPTHSLFVLTNEKPHVGDDYAIWKRLVLIGHPYSFVSDPSQPDEKLKDAGLKDKLKGCASGILRWMVEGALLWHVEGGLRPPASVRQETEEYQASEDLLGEWAAVSCWISEALRGRFVGLDDSAFIANAPDDLKTSFKDLYESFDEWYRNNKKSKGMSPKAVGMLLKKRFDSEKIGTMYYYGVGLRSTQGD